MDYQRFFRQIVIRRDSVYQQLWKRISAVINLQIITDHLQELAVYCTYRKLRNFNF
jgi:hypothetical protein